MYRRKAIYYWRRRRPTALQEWSDKPLSTADRLASLLDPLKTTRNGSLTRANARAIQIVASPCDNWHGRSKAAWDAGGSVYLNAVVHLVANQLTDRSADLAGVGECDDRFPLPHGRGDEFYHSSPGNDPRGLPLNGLRTRDIYIPDLHIDSIKAKTRDLR